jgi:hypothetical protein
LNASFIFFEYLCAWSEFYRFGHMYHNLQPRVTKTFLHCFLDPTKALPQHYGAIKGITALGSRLVYIFKPMCFNIRRVDW